MLGFEHEMCTGSCVEHFIPSWWCHFERFRRLWVARIMTFTIIPDLQTLPQALLPVYDEVKRPCLPCYGPRINRSSYDGQKALKLFLL
jgi:hypothetical protein